MRICAKLGLTALLAALLLSAAVGAASAGRFELGNQQIRVTWSRIEFVGTVIMRCQFTLEGSFYSRTIARTPASIGAITRVAIQNSSCTKGTAAVRSSSLPWDVHPESFTGTLPNITSVQVLVSRFLFELIVLGRTCKYGRPTDRIAGRASIAAGVLTTLQPVAGSNTANLLEGNTSGLTPCPLTGRMEGGAADGRITVLSSTASVTIRLI